MINLFLKYGRMKSSLCYFRRVFKASFTLGELLAAKMCLATFLFTGCIYTHYLLFKLQNAITELKIKFTTQQTENNSSFTVWISKFMECSKNEQLLYSDKRNSIY